MPPTFDAVYLDLILGIVGGGAVGFGSGLPGAKATLVTEVTAAAPTGSGLGG